MKYVTEGIAEALYQRRIDESVDEGKDWSGFKVRYTYAGDSLSDYEATCIVKAKDEKEAVKIAMKKINADAARNFRIDGKIDSYAKYKKDFPNSGFDVFESSDIEEGVYDGTPTVAVPHDFSSQDWNSKKVAERIKIYLDYFEDAKKSGRKMKRAEIDQNFNKLSRICLGIQTQQDYAGANQLLNLADNNGFVYKKYVEKLVNDLSTGKRFNLKGTPNVVEEVEEVEEVEDDITEALKVVKSGKVQIKKAFTVKEFDEDDGWVEIKIKPGTYKYQVIDFRGWKPRQIEVNGEWVDVAGDCVELEELLGNSKIDGSKKIVEARQSLKGGITAHKVKKGMKLVGNRKYIENHDESDIYHIIDVSDLGKGEIMIKYSKLGIGNSSKVFDEDDVVGFLIKEGVEEAATYSTDKKSDKQKKAAELAIKNLIFKMDECEIASNQFSYAHLSNDKMAELMSEVDPKYEYEVEVHTEPSKRFGKITHHIMMRVKK